MKVINPYFDDPVQAFAESKAANVQTFLQNNSSERVVTFEQVRAAFPNVNDPRTGVPPMTDGSIAAIFQHLGYEVTE
ncbi:hypothetical protein [Marinobacter sp.]|uniref:hypothetical protein n=1 Tax=Marinobacter sp. TaxID=50741 RepID=UPI0035C6852C